MPVRSDSPPRYSDLFSSAPYNMALVGEAQETNLQTIRRLKRLRADTSPQLVGVVVDKLRLSFYSSISPEDLPACVMGLNKHRLGFARRVGDQAVPRCKAWTKPPRVEGGVYYQCDKLPFLPSGSSLIVAEFNPAKLDDAGWAFFGATLAKMGVTDPDTLFVDRYDAAFDYLAPRPHLMLSDMRRVMDLFGVSRNGPETERTGFRRGSDLRSQLYDKTAERASTGSQCVKDLTRFELMVSSPAPVSTDAPLYGSGPSDVLCLGDLHLAGYPGRDITVRAVAFNALRVADHVYGSLAAYARALGLRAALGYARKVFGLNAAQRAQWLDTLLPELDNAPRIVWPQRWASAVDHARVQIHDNLRASL